MADAPSIFSKGQSPAEETKPTPTVPAVPVGRLVPSPRRQIGRGTRDTLLTGANGLPN